MKTLLKTTFFFVIAGLCSCSTIFEKDISSQDVQVIAPADSLVTETFSILFWWEPVAGASHYSLQVVTPNFDAPSSLVIDTLLNQTKFEVTLSPGTYSWRINAQNSGYQSAYQYRTFTVESTNDLGRQLVKLLSPTNQSFTNRSTLRFEWEELSIADSYRFELEGVSGGRQELTDNFVEFEIGNAEREYQWTVTAVNEESIKRSEVFRFTTDFTRPLSPILINLSDGDTLTTIPFLVNWERRSSDIVRDSIFLYLDESLSTPVEGYPQSETQGAHSLTTQLIRQEGRYYIQVKSVDRAGNVSNPTEVQSFLYKSDEE